MIIYKFGGASVKDEWGIRNLAGIVKEEKDLLVIVISAFGKTTNALEQVLTKWFHHDPSYRDVLQQTVDYHRGIAAGIMPEGSDSISHFESEVSALTTYLESNSRGSFDYEYDQIVTYGEVWSTIIVSGYLATAGEPNQWVDIRRVLVTDNRYRDAEIQWPESLAKVRRVFRSDGPRRYVTQGFIGGTRDGKTVSLGREGSDYTAAILANMLDAERVIVWKDVPGLLNADPKWLPDTTVLPAVSYKEAVEMTFSGAKVIHPKTIKPLHNKSIPLHVKSFVDPSAEGTIIWSEAKIAPTVPVFVRKENQIMVSILPRDFSFAIGENLSTIFVLLAEAGIKVNLVQASAVSVNICADYDPVRFSGLIDGIGKEFRVIYNEKVEMLTIRHYTPESVQMLTGSREVLLEQRTRRTVRFVVRGTP
jgi:aspartate kinase